MSFKTIFKYTIPVMLGYIPLGAAYALLATQIGLKEWQIVLMSFVVYAGSGQFLLVTLFSAGATLVEIFVATFLLNLRHIFYTTTLLEDILKLKNKFYVMFALTDESFALLKTLKIDDENKDKTYFYIVFLNQIYWIVGTILGIVVGKNLQIDYSGIEFSLVALFVVLAIELFKSNKNYKILFISLFLGIFGMIFLPDKFMLITTLVIGFIILLAFRKSL
ncbi:AzlC family ABC transporter permease [Campylobacter geochelonis]|uniref:Branched-chain amino acid transport protein n=1 Tax=Campylobacter geochelonis TaxID=1780362 RepID=A0A128EN34_9BACT|nr:AzlC family ABC transporter permease [Campylobacter geochelonis]QKF71100.1 branched-chain amino acid transport protein, AzlC family [Campylobacter geochelonis]CZE48335.1 branched-chain amino acid transport protein [Campylobacter geochelonis]CZE48893.1 branched-chain amino acid transport protein [Campylobacter geochelonis]CZE50084.1 branched-chain amino acid transport protein [Campylobacter geochelonis]